MANPAKLSPLTLGPADYSFMDPTGATFAAPTVASKVRRFDACGLPLVSGGAFQGAQIQYGTRVGDTPSLTAVTTNAGTLDALGDSDSLADGRITRVDGIFTLKQLAGDQVLSNCPRCQYYGYPFQANQRLQVDLSVRFRSDDIPFPAYVLDKDEIGFFEIKGPTTNPPVNLVVDNWPTDTSRLRVRFFWKPFNNATTQVLATFNNLDPDGWHDFFIDMNTSYRGRGNKGPWIKLWFNGEPVAMPAAWVGADPYAVYRTPFNADVVGSGNYWQIKMAEIYRYQYYSAVQPANGVAASDPAPDACAIQWRRCAVYGEPMRAATDFGDRTPVMTRATAAARATRGG